MPFDGTGYIDNSGRWVWTPDGGKGGPLDFSLNVISPSLT